MRRRNSRYEWLVNAVGKPTKECIVWPFQKDKDGYGRLRPLYEGNRITVGAHRLAFKLLHGRWPKPCGLHICDNTSCVNPQHIFEGTIADNNQDRASKGRGCVGEMQKDAKLTEEIVRKARKEYIPRKFGFHRLAGKYGVTKRAMRLAVIGKTWRHVNV